MNYKLFIFVLLSMLISSIAVYATSPTSCDGQWADCADANANGIPRARFTATNTVQGSGVWYNYCFSIANDATISNVMVRADFLSSNPRGFIDVKVSGDGGLTYGPSHIVGGNTREKMFNIDVTNDLAWMPDKLNTSNFRVSVTCFKSPATLTNPVCRLDWIPVSVTSVCGAGSACTPGNITNGSSCGGTCDIFRKECKADCNWGPWICKPGTTVTRNCTQYQEAVFYRIHGLSVDQSIINPNILNQVVGGAFYACPPLDSDRTCCPVNSCVYNGVCYTNGETLDIDTDDVREICVTHSPGRWIDEFEYNCTDGIDDDLDGLIDCQDNDCSGTISGAVKNQKDQDVEGATVSIDNGSAILATAISFGGNYQFPLNSIKCGTYNLIASHPDYFPSTKSNVVLNPREDLQYHFVQSSALNFGSSCEPDCTLLSDNTVHASCDTKNGCTFYDDTSKAACDNSQPGWIRDYDETHYVVCAPGAPQLKVEAQASISCPSGTLIKVTRIVLYNGKPVKLVVAACS